MNNEMDLMRGQMGFGPNHIRVCQFDEHSAIRFHDQVTQKAAMDPISPIVVYIDSFGGQVDSLASMLETLESVPNQIITVCVGKAMSCGAILLSAGDYRFCGKHSRIMIHAVGGMAGGDAYAIKTSSDESTRLNEYWLDFFAKNCKLSGYDEMKAILDKAISREIYFTAEEAKAFGLIEEIGMPAIKPLVMFQVDAISARERSDGQGVSLADMVGAAIEEMPTKKTTKKKVSKKTTKKKVTKKTTKK